MFSRIAAVAVLIAASSPASAQAPAPDSWIQDTTTGCRIRNPAPQPRETVTWSSACPNGIAEGTGILQWFDDDRPTDRYEGGWLDGRLNGRGTYTDAADTVFSDTWSRGCFLDGGRKLAVSTTARDCGFE